MARLTLARQSPTNREADGLRVVATLLVVTSAAGLGLRGGLIGIDVAYVLAGFGVTEAAVRRAAAGEFSVREFLAHGARRVLPLTSLGVVGAIVATALFLDTDALLAVARDARLAALLGLNWLLAADHVNTLRPGASTSPLLHYWAIATGAQMVVAWVFLLALVLRHGTRPPMLRRAAVLAALISLLSLAWSVVQTGSNPTTAFVSPLTRLWEVGAGSLIVLLGRETLLLPARVRFVGRWIGLAAIVIAAAAFGQDSAFPGWIASIPVLGAVAVIASGRFGEARP